MAEKTLTVLLIEDNAEYATLVQRWLSSDAEKEKFHLNWADTLEAGLKRLAQGQVDVVLLDLGLPDSGGSTTFDAVSKCSAAVPVIVLSGGDNERLALRMIEGGAQDYIVKSTCTDERLGHALRYAVVRHQARTAMAKGETGIQKRVVGVVGSCGGVGVTTVATIMAAEARQLTSQSVLAIDLDLHQGAMSFALGLESKRSLFDAVQNVERLDADVLEGIVVRREGEFDILASPILMGASDLTPASIEQVIERSREAYDWIFLDLGRLDRASATAAGLCTDVLLVASLGISSLHQSRRMLEALDVQGITADRVRLIINRRGERCDLTRQELRRLFGSEIFAALPDAHDDLYQAYLEKRLPDPSCELRRELSAAMRRLAGIEDEKAAGAARAFAFFANRFRSHKETPVETVSQ